jgi:hypothetical protein
VTSRTKHLLSQRLASEVALSSVLEKALLLQRTLLTGKKEPNVAANELAVEAVNKESDTLDQRDPATSRRNWNCAASWPTTRRWPSFSAIARALRVRAASTRAIRCPTVSTNSRRAIREVGHERGSHDCVHYAGCSAGTRRKRCYGLCWSSPPPWGQRRRASTWSAVSRPGSGGWRPVRRVFLHLATVPVRRYGLWMGLDAPQAAGPRRQHAGATSANPQQRSPASLPLWRWKPAC